LTLTGRLNPQVIEKLASLLENMEFGTVQITVHDSQVTQIEKIEKHRFQLQKKANIKTPAHKKTGNF